jgi:pimeloyl-ACP methyl ester carboxylesterase
VQWLDSISAKALTRTPPHRRVFRDGWGDPGVLEWYSSIVGNVPSDIPDIDLVEGSPVLSKGLTVSDLRFQSPALHLPDASQPARARLITPDREPQRICLLMAAWNEHGYGARTKLARLLAAEGIATVILENPMYGDRRTDPGDSRPLGTVSDFAVMGRAAVVEGRALLAHFHRQGLHTGVGGFSMGGNIAAFVGATVPFPTAIAVVSASHSPSPPFLQGAISRAVAFEALGGDTPETRQRLHQFMLSASVLDYEPREHTRAAVLLAGTIDGIVPTSAVQALHRHWPGSRLEWVHAGHATLLWLNKDRMAAATVDAFNRVDAMFRPAS